MTHATAAMQAYEQRVLAAVREQIGARLRALALAGVDLTTLGDPDDVAARAAAAVPYAPHTYDLPFGPFYDTTGLTGWLGISRQALADRVRRGSVLAGRTDDGRVVYPAFQFGRDATVRAELIDVLRAFAGHDGWAVAAWLTTVTAALDGHSALDWLALGRDPSVVIDLAVADATGWAA
jgi:hypothetical protein